MASTPTEYDGHPDYQCFIQRAETGLAEASMAKRPRMALS